MSFKEISAWIILVALLWVFGSYAGSLFQAGGFGVATSGIMIGAIIGFVFLVVAGHIVVAIAASRHIDSDDEEDERDRRIEAKADRLAGIILTIAALNALGFALYDGAFRIANILFLGLAASEIIKNVWQIILYRRSS